MFTFQEKGIGRINKYEKRSMKNLITTAGLAALGIATLETSYAQGLSSQMTSKPWSVSASVRGFYDDNYATAPREVKRSSFGFELQPSAGLNIIKEQTTIGLSYLYGYRYYEDRDRPGEHPEDQSHIASAKLSHAFTPRYKLDVSDSFVVAQEPEVIDPQIITSPLRTEGNNIRNTGNIAFTGGLADNLDVVLAYNNTYYDYQQTGVGSRSALLDRMEHLGTANLRWQVLPQTVGILGYQYGVVDYSSNDPLGFIGLTPVSSRLRDSHSHFGYLGVDQAFSPTLNASVRIGAEFREYDNPVAGSPNDVVSPYVDANSSWTYGPGSYIQLGVRHARNQTDVGFYVGGLSPALDVESTTVYGSLNHKLWGGLIGSLIAQYQNSEFQSGLVNGFEDNLFLAGVNFTYEFNRFIGVEAGYNYDRLDSDLNKAPVNVSRSYTRNRVYIGIRATF
jgi:hypothetical protein